MLFGDEHFKIAVRVSVRELTGVSGVAYFTVQRHHPRITGTECDECIAIGLARGHRFADCVSRPFRLGYC